MDRQVTLYINKQTSPQKEICNKLRQIILNACPNIEEKMKLGVPMYDDKYYIVALKDHVNLGFNIKGMAKDEIELFEGGGKAYKIKEYLSVKEISLKEIIKFLSLVR